MKCPNCKHEVRASETYDTDWCDTNYYDFVEGTCPNCGKNWQWTEVYIFDHVEEVEEIKDDRF